MAKGTKMTADFGDKPKTKEMTEKVIALVNGLGDATSLNGRPAFDKEGLLRDP